MGLGAVDRITAAAAPQPHLDPRPLCVKGEFAGGVGARLVVPLACGLMRVLGCGLGPGSDLSEESAFQDVEPATLETESFLGVLPGPTYWVLCWSATRWR